MPNPEPSPVTISVFFINPYVVESKVIQDSSKSLLVHLRWFAKLKPIRSWLSAQGVSWKLGVTSTYQLRIRCIRRAHLYSFSNYAYELD